MDLWAALLAAVVGYLAGAISFSRVVVRAVDPDQNLERTTITTSDGKVRFESTSVSASVVRLKLGPRYGCLASSLDMLKVIVPALLFRLWKPDQPYYVLSAGMGTVGHNWPVYYRFKGGRGMSPILAGMLVMDWLGVLVTQSIGAVVVLTTRTMLGLGGPGIALMIPWIWFRTHDWVQLGYVVAMNVFFWWAMRPEMREMRRLKREGNLETFREAPKVRVLGRRGTEIIQQATISSMFWSNLSKLWARKQDPTGDNDPESAGGGEEKGGWRTD